MEPPPAFRTDLYRGTAAYYDQYRPPYPSALFDDLRRRLPISGRGRLLDLACGTGQIAFPLAGDFAEVVAVDQEAETIDFARSKAEAAGMTQIRWMIGAAETLALEGPFELVAVGNAFHRLDRSRLAERTLDWLQPGGGVALVWGDLPTQGERPWQKTLECLFAEWMDRAGARERLPEGWAAAIETDPHEDVLRRAGLAYAGRFEFSAEQTWTIESLTGLAYSTSILNRGALGGLADDFASALAEGLLAAVPDGIFRQEATYAYELARKP
ncbi:MAG: class I SAM-dependent methyltransferase [Acidimicrobiaceae bacterium]|nr:class I SAM-dependent methyltransferase [Acidimicrobiaceae bacterium]